VNNKNTFVTEKNRFCCDFEQLRRFVMLTSTNSLITLNHEDSVSPNENEKLNQISATHEMRFSAATSDVGMMWPTRCYCDW